MTCETCDMKLRGAYDFKCEDCCVRYLKSMPDRERVAGALWLIKKRQGSDFHDNVMEKWKAVVEKRKAAREESLSAIKLILGG